MRIAGHDTRDSVFIIAEIGNNHEGDPDVARALVHEAAKAGVDAVKFQTFRTEHYVSSRDADRFARLKGFELSIEDLTALAVEARRKGLSFLSTPFDLFSARDLEPLVDAFKIASGDNTFYPLIDEVCTKGKPVIISTGASDLQTVRRAYERARAAMHHRSSPDALGILHCVSSYPVPLDQASLGAVDVLRSEFPEATIGYSDHTQGIEAAGIAVAGGARIIEKHFTLDHKYSDFRDHALSAEPDELYALVEHIRHIEVILGRNEKRIQLCEQPAAEAIRRSIVTTRDLPAGTRLREIDITWVRPGGGLAPGAETSVLGRKTRKPLVAGTPLAPDLLE